MASDTQVQSPNEKGHSAPCSDRDYDFFYRGLEQQRLLVLKCRRCGAMRNPPAPRCGQCQSFESDELELRGTGALHSWIVHCHPPVPGFIAPFAVGLVNIDEGVRMLGAMDETPPEELEIGMRVTTEFVRRGDVTLFRFKKA